MIVCFVFQTIVSCFDRKSRREVLFFFRTEVFENRFCFPFSPTNVASHPNFHFSNTQHYKSFMSAA